MRDLAAEAAEQNKSTYKSHQSKTKTLERCSWNDESVEICFSAQLYSSLMLVCRDSEKVEEDLHKSDYDGGGVPKSKQRQLILPQWCQSRLDACVHTCERGICFPAMPTEGKEWSDLRLSSGRRGQSMNDAAARS